MGYTFNSMLTSNLNNSTGDGTAVNLVCDQVLANQNSVYDNSTGQMTSVGSANYMFQGNICLSGLTILHTSVLVELVTSARTYNVADFQGLSLNSSVYQINFAQVAFLSADETAFVRVTVDGSFKTVDILGNSTISRTNFAGILPVV